MVCLVDGTCLGAFREISTSLVSLVRDPEKQVLIKLWSSFHISFLLGYVGPY